MLSMPNTSVTSIRHATFALAILSALSLGGCRREAVGDVNTAVAVVSTGLATPESVLWDERHNVWYVSNINGSPLAADDNGYITRLTAEGELMDSVPFISGTSEAITLHAPKGMALIGDTLWVTDITSVRAFNVITGGLVASIDLAPQQATFLNDAAAGPDGNVYITDSGIAFDAAGNVSHPGKSRVFVITRRTARQAVELPRESAANGIAWDAEREAWLLVGFNSPSVYLWVPGADSVVVLGNGPGGGDGLAVLTDGRALYTSWADSSLTFFANGTSTTMRKGLPAPADIGYDPARNIVAVPLFNANRVELWRIPAGN
jgi:sugar lactone lactonase YvrE